MGTVADVISKENVAKAAESLRNKLYQDYETKTANSRSMYRRACNSLAGGVSGNLRLYSPYPLYMSKGRGSKVFDVDDNSYIDCFMGNGPLLLGHLHRDIVQGIDRYRDFGSLIFNPEIMIECAELLGEIVPCSERVRFLNSGTEAVLSAVRIARAFTGKPKILKFYGQYSGQDDQFLVGGDTSAKIISAGIPKESVANTLLLEFNNIEALQNKLKEDKDIAAVIVDPALQKGGVWPANNDYLHTLRKITSEHGVLLIFDEVITGFRVALGGAQEFYGVTPDMAVFAKALGAGEKLAAVVGRTEIMNVLCSDNLSDNFGGGGKDVFQSGTANDCSVAMCAGIAAMGAYKQMDKSGAYDHLETLGQALADGIRGIFKTRNIPCHVNQWGSLIRVFLGAENLTFKTQNKANNDALTMFFLGLLNEGVFTVPSSGNIFLSFAHTSEDVNTILEKAEVVMNKYDIRQLF